jgi:hypothetical protein
MPSKTVPQYLNVTLKVVVTVSYLVVFSIGSSVGKREDI